ncbi:hypothetical protein IAT40_005489 [Kwoniella sp. CBS 6097]
MKTSTSFAILALLASAGSALAAPLPLPHGHNEVNAAVAMHHGGNNEHHHVTNNGRGKHHHARATAHKQDQSQQGQTVGMGALATANVNLPQNNQSNGKGQSQPKSKNNSNSSSGSGASAIPIDGSNTLSSTSSSRKNAVKPVASAGNDTGKTLSNPGSKSGQIGHLGSTADDALQPETTQVAKTLPKRAQGDGNVVGSAVKQSKPLETAATGINKNANVGSVGNVANGKGDLPIVGGIVKPLTAGSAPLPQVTTGVLNGKTTNGLLGSAEKLLTSTTGSLTGGKGSVVNTNGGNKVVNSQGTANGVNKLPNTVDQSHSFDPLNNDAAKVNTDSTESHAQKQTKQTTNNAANSGPNQNTKKVNNLAFSGNGTTHRADPRPADGGVSTSHRIVNNSTQTADKSTENGTENGNTSSNIVGVKTDDNQVNTNNVGSSAQRGGNQALNSSTRPVDPVFDAALPANKSNGSLLTVTSQDANGKVAQTPGKSNKVAEANSNDLTGSKDKNQNINVKVATPQQAQAGSSTVSGPTGGDNNGNGNGVVNTTNNGKTVGPNDQNGSVIKQAQEGKLLKQDVVATSASQSAKSQSKTKSSAPHSSATHAHPKSSASAPSSATSSASVKPQVYIAQTASSSSSSAVTSTAPATSATLLAQANVQSGTVKVIKNDAPTSIVQLSATSSVPLNGNGNVNSIASSAAPSASAVVNKAIVKPRQAQVSYGQKGEHIVACDGQTHSNNDVVDECISADLLDFRPNQTEACPTDMQHNIKYGASTDQLNDNAAAQEIQKYVRLCLTANSL